MSLPSPHRSFLVAIACVALAGNSVAEPGGVRTEIAHAGQPQLFAAADGRVWLVYGRGPEIYVARSDDAGATFSAENKVATTTKLMLGMRRGPRIAAHGDTVTVTAIGEELVAFNSTDGGKSWSGPVRVNDTPTCAREGLHDLAVAPDGRLFVTWLDLREGAMQLWGDESSDGGKTWARNAQVYKSPDKSICECCHPSALFDREGNLAVMWRNSVAGSRDLWMATRPRDAAGFSAARKLGTGTWTLNACPMDGGRILPLGGGQFGSVWQRAGEIYLSLENGPETMVGKGKQPVAITRQGGTTIIWQDGADLVSTTVPAARAAAGRVTETAPTKRATDARFPNVVALGGDRGVLLAYEKIAGDAPAAEHAAMHSGSKPAGTKPPAKMTHVIVERL